MDYLIVGLGNPGEKYKHTRHNIGFDILDEIALQYNLSFKSDKFAQKAEWEISGKKVLLIKPDTFMNLSGKAFQYWLNWYKIPITNSLIVLDDIALPIGKMRMRKGGSSGGHNGLKDIERTLGTNEYPRLRFGVGNEFKDGKQIDFVLGKFSESDRIIVNLTIEKSQKAIESFILKGIDKTMEAFNH
ncbi:MAG: aminoacyl-tRNA hydrolase [Bacteroidetes bacterium]|nr:aminoacyl-tRNA hydrolase [Bacteroidota bacterium]